MYSYLVIHPQQLKYIHDNEYESSIKDNGMAIEDDQSSARNDGLGSLVSGIACLLTMIYKCESQPVMMLQVKMTALHL